MSAAAWMLLNKHLLLLSSISTVQTFLSDKQKTDGKNVNFFQ